MNTNKAGIALIKEFEGFRSKAYKDAVGVWTIGYGHTSMAGPPDVKRGLTITNAEGEKILKRDLVKYENAVADLLKVEVSSNQFSAMVSLCYNIGPANFKKSSVIRFVNKRQWQNAANAFALWNKAGGRVLAGLTRRRAAEAALFLKDDEVSESNAMTLIDVPKGKPAVMSTTNIAAASAGAAGVTAAVRDVADNAKEIVSGVDVTMVLIGVIVVAVGWIIWERYKKSRDWDI